MNSVRSNNLSLKYQGFPPLGCQDIRIRKFEFVAKTQFLCKNVLRNLVIKQKSSYKGKIRHLGSTPEDSGSRYKSPAFSLKSEAYVN